MKIEKFEDLEIWKESLDLAEKIYLITNNNSKFNKDFCLRDQIRRAVISINSNISEGFERSNNNEFIRFLKIAKGSAGEVRAQLCIAYKIKYLDKKDFEIIYKEIQTLSRKMGGFINYLEKKRKNKEFIK